MFGELRGWVCKALLGVWRREAKINMNSTARHWGSYCILLTRLGRIGQPGTEACTHLMLGTSSGHSDQLTKLSSDQLLIDLLGDCDLRCNVHQLASRGMRRPRFFRQG